MLQRDQPTDGSAVEKPITSFLLALDVRDGSVVFTHERHVRAGVRCRECHGDVERMEIVRQVASLEMGWCLGCHHRKQREQPGRERLTDCVTCHK